MSTNSSTEHITEHGTEHGAEPPGPGFGQWLLCILWPSFLMAGVMEMLVFAVVDPSDLHWFGGPAIDWPRQAIYTVSFFIFWAVISLAGALTALLALAPGQINNEGGYFRGTR